MVLPCFGGQSSARLHKIVSIASSLAQIFPSRLGGVAMPLLLVWVPPPPQVTLQGDHVLQVSQIQSKGFASEIKKTMARLKLVTIMRISEIQSKDLHTTHLDHNNLSIISSLTITLTPYLTRIWFMYPNFIYTNFQFFI